MVPFALIGPKAKWFPQQKSQLILIFGILTLYFLFYLRSPKTNFSVRQFFIVYIEFVVWRFWGNFYLFHVKFLIEIFTYLVDAYYYKF